MINELDELLSEFFDEEDYEEVDITPEQVDHANNCFDDLCVYLKKPELQEGFCEILARDPEERSIMLRYHSRHVTLFIHMCIDAGREALKLTSYLPIRCQEEYKVVTQQFCGIHKYDYGRFLLGEFGQIMFQSQICIAESTIGKRALFEHLNEAIEACSLQFVYLNRMVNARMHPIELQLTIQKLEDQLRVLKEGKKVT